MGIWKDVRHTIVACMSALNSRSIRKDECDVGIWNNPSIDARTSTFLWNCDRSNCSGRGGPQCRKLKVDRSVGSSKMKIEVT